MKYHNFVYKDLNKIRNNNAMAFCARDIVSSFYWVTDSASCIWPKSFYLIERDVLSGTWKLLRGTFACLCYREPFQTAVWTDSIELMTRSIALRVLAVCKNNTNHTNYKEAKFASSWPGYFLFCSTLSCGAGIRFTPLLINEGHWHLCAGTKKSGSQCYMFVRNDILSRNN